MALMSGAQQGLSVARATEASGAVGRQGEEQALESLLHRAAGADPEERPALKAALAALANGDTLLAEASFEQEVDASRRLRLAAILSRLARCRLQPQGVRYQCLEGPPLVRASLTTSTSWVNTWGR